MVAKAVAAGFHHHWVGRVAVGVTNAAAAAIAAHLSTVSGAISQVATTEIRLISAAAVVEITQPTTAFRMNSPNTSAPVAKRLSELEVENGKLKRIVADQVLDMSAMKELLGRHW